MVHLYRYLFLYINIHETHIHTHIYTNVCMHIYIHTLQVKHTHTKTNMHKGGMHYTHLYALYIIHMYPHENKQIYTSAYSYRHTYLQIENNIYINICHINYLIATYRIIILCFRVVLGSTESYNYI